MKAKELAKILLEDPEREIVLASDGEGNSYSFIGDDSVSRAAATKEGRVGLEKLTPALRERGYSQDDVVKNGIKVFVLYPY